MDCRGPFGDAVAADGLACVFVVRAMADHELHLVARPQAGEVLPVHAIGFAAVALDVEDRHDGSGTEVLRWPPVSSRTVLPRASSSFISG